MNDQTSAIFAPLVGKGLIQVDGEEAAAFLQTILTANIDKIAVGDCSPGALLTPQGRVLHDMMIYRCPTGANASSHFITLLPPTSLARPSPGWSRSQRGTATAGAQSHPV